MLIVKIYSYLTELVFAVVSGKVTVLLFIIAVVHVCKRMIVGIKITSEKIGRKGNQVERVYFVTSFDISKLKVPFTVRESLLAEVAEISRGKILCPELCFPWAYFGDCMNNFRRESVSPPAWFHRHIRLRPCLKHCSQCNIISLHPGIGGNDV